MRFKCLLAAAFFTTSFFSSPVSASLESDCPKESLDTEFSNSLALKSFEDDLWSSATFEFPEIATFSGLPGDHDRWTDDSLEAHQKRHSKTKAFAKRLKTIDRSALSKEKQFHYDILEWMFEGDEPFPFHYLAINQQNGIHHTIPLLLGTLPAATREGYESVLSRMSKVPCLVDQTIELLKKGMELGIVAPKIIMRAVPGQILEQISFEADESPFFSVFATQEDLELKKRAVDAIESDIYPSFQKLYLFISAEYIPACRDSVGLIGLPNGKIAYAQAIKEHTTTSLSADEIHQIGLKEVAKIAGKISRLIAQVGFEGSHEDFARSLKERDEFYYQTKADLLQGFRDTLKVVEGNLPKLFGKLPVLPCEIVAVPGYLEAAAPAAYYYPGSIKSGRPGVFFVNTYSLEDHPTWQTEALALHEALPGHHFQLSLAQEADIPLIFQHSHTTAFIEGWGLYSESLGKELGLYQDPYSYYGRLSCEMLRAVRLVVDTGLHEYGWSREKAMRYYQKHLVTSDHEAANEIDRYIAMPGQALAYKIGEHKIKALRRRQEIAKGADFDIRSFHDDLLQLGNCLPLDVLDRYLK